MDAQLPKLQSNFRAILVIFVYNKSILLVKFIYAQAMKKLQLFYF